MKGYKAFNSDWTCRGFQYEVGKTYEMEEEPVLCVSGFHFCEELKDCFIYYNALDIKLAEIEALGEIQRGPRNNKCCTDKIKIVREISFEEALEIMGIKTKLWENFLKLYKEVSYLSALYCGTFSYDIEIPYNWACVNKDFQVTSAIRDNEILLSFSNGWDCRFEVLITEDGLAIPPNYKYKFDYFKGEKAKIFIEAIIEYVKIEYLKGWMI